MRLTHLITPFAPLSPFRSVDRLGQEGIATAFARERIGSEVDVLIDREDPEAPGCFLGRTMLEAPDVDPVVFVSPPRGAGLAALAAGQLRRCRVNGSVVFDLEAYPVA